MKIVHTVSYGPGTNGIHEAARDIARADMLSGHEVKFVDTGYMEKGIKKYSPIGSIDDRGGA